MIKLKVYICFAKKQLTIFLIDLIPESSLKSV